MKTVEHWCVKMSNCHYIHVYDRGNDICLYKKSYCLWKDECGICHNRQS